MTGQSPQPPGWYPDPAQPGFLRYWDGTQWSAHTHPLPVPTPPNSTTPGRGCLVAVLLVVGVPVVLGGVVAAIIAIESALNGTGGDAPGDRPSGRHEVTYAPAAAEQRRLDSVPLTGANPVSVRFGAGYRT